LHGNKEPVLSKGKLKFACISGTLGLTYIKLFFIVIFAFGSYSARQCHANLFKRHELWNSPVTP
jgi:hypothetical protein